MSHLLVTACTAEGHPRRLEAGLAVNSINNTEGYF